MTPVELHTMGALGIGLGMGSGLGVGMGADVLGGVEGSSEVRGEVRGEGDGEGGGEGADDNAAAAGIGDGQTDDVIAAAAAAAAAPGVPLHWKPGFTYRPGANKRSAEQNSGAYIFRPDSSEHSQPQPVSPTASISVVRGELVTEVRQVWASWVTQVFRLEHDSDQVTVEWTVGPIPTDDGVGKEVP